MKCLNKDKGEKTIDLFDNPSVMYKMFKTIPFQKDMLAYGEHWYDMTLMLDGKETNIEFTKNRTTHYTLITINVSDMFCFEASYRNVVSEDKLRPRYYYTAKRLYVYENITVEDVENIMALIVLCREDFV